MGVGRNSGLEGQEAAGRLRGTLMEGRELNLATRNEHVEPRK